MLSIETSESLWDAWQLMFVGGMRHIAVMDQDICRGVLSDRTVLTDLPVSPDSMRARSVGDAMHTANSQMVGPTTLVCDAALLMAQAPCDALAVIDSEHRVLGVLTSDDIVRWVAAGGGCAEN